MRQPSLFHSIACQGNRCMALLATAIALLFALGGCSQKNDKTPNVNSINQTLPTRPPASVPAAQPVAAALEPSKPAKKTPNKRPTMVSYTDHANGLSFRYPRKYMLKTGAEVQTALGSEPVPMNFVLPGGTWIVAVLLPADSYAQTDFTSAFFNVSVNKNLTSSECAQFALPGQREMKLIPPATVKIGGTAGQQVENLSQGLDSKYYHIFANGTCYEFALGLMINDRAADEITPVDRQEVFGKLAKILATVTIKSRPASELAQQSTSPADGGTH